MTTCVGHSDETISLHTAGTLNKERGTLDAKTHSPVSKFNNDLFQLITIVTDYVFSFQVIEVVYNVFTVAHCKYKNTFTLCEVSNNEVIEL